MNKQTKAFANTPKKADPAADIELINQHTLTPLKPDDVYCFSATLCDNQPDRDNEYFSDTCLLALSHLFVGRPVIFDHKWSAHQQVARVYRCEVVDAGFGGNVKRLKGSAYMPRSGNDKLISLIETGMLKEVSVSFSANNSYCSICGHSASMKDGCSNGHVKGEEYNGRTCYTVIDGVTDAFELSFVAVPAQPGAGVTKSTQDAAMIELEERRSILRENTKYMKYYRKMEENTMISQKANGTGIDAEVKAAFYSAALKDEDRARVVGRYKELGIILNDRNLLPTKLSEEILLNPNPLNPLRFVEPITIVNGLEIPLLELDIKDCDLADVADADSANEIEGKVEKATFKRNKMMISFTVTDTVLHLSGRYLVSAIETAMRRGIAKKEMLDAFGEDEDSRSFYHNDIETVTGPSLIRAICAALSDLSEEYAQNAAVIMSRAQYFDAVEAESAAVRGARPEDIFLCPVYFCEYAELPVIGDFTYSHQNYDTPPFFAGKGHARKGLYDIVLTTWSDHKILDKNAFRLAATV